MTRLIALVFTALVCLTACSSGTVTTASSPEVSSASPSQPRTYSFHCNYHPMMRGQLIVQ